MSDNIKPFLKALEALHAGSSAKAWVASQPSGEAAWAACDREVWMGWLVNALRIRPSAPALAEYERATASADAEYQRVTATAKAECDRATASACAECDRVTATALAEYRRVTAPAYRVMISWEAIREAIKQRLGIEV